MPQHPLKLHHLRPQALRPFLIAPGKEPLSLEPARQMIHAQIKNPPDTSHMPAVLIVSQSRKIKPEILDAFLL